MIQPIQWTDTELASLAEDSRHLFREERLREPLDRWRREFDQRVREFRALFRKYGIPGPGSLTPEQLAPLVRDGLGDALRYISGPPISKDDLEVLAEASLAPATLASDAKSAERILRVIAETMDPRRFPWVAENRKPTKQEKAVAIYASAALLAAQRSSTERRSDGKRAQEDAVKQLLRNVGLREVKPRPMSTIADAPGIGEFCGESLVGSRKADIAIRLFDSRLMPVECKVSNSATNSVKRLNNDAVVKAVRWREELGSRQVAPAAVLAGVFKVHNLISAQASGLALYFSHELEDLASFVTATSSGAPSHPNRG